MITLHDKDALISIARNGDHPIAFLVGAPLSTDAGGGVPGVAPMLALVRDEVSRRAASELARYDAAMAGKSGGDAYQAAMAWLQGNVGQDAVNRVIESAVLKARKAGADPAFKDIGDPADWYIPPGTQQLGQLVCRELKESKNRFPGPILTTNFDPLLSLAIESCGAHAHWRVVQSDGKLADVRTKTAVEVIHLHGFWRGTDTLHTAAQLTSNRPHLRDSLRRILKQKTLLVAAYGGWDDVFARALAEVAADDDAELTVLWCFYDKDAASIEAKYKELLARVEPAITRGRFLCYGGIDCHSIFGEIAGVAPVVTVSTPTAPSATVTPASVPPPLAGWEIVDAAYLAGLPPLRPEEVIRYFDGATPTLRHATCADIPRRAAVAEIGRRLTSARAAKDDGSLQLIRAAGGEGKTTLLLQAAADAGNGGDWNVLWRPTPRVGLPAEHVVTLNPAKQWLIVADDAENLADDVSEAARLLHDAGRANVHFLLAARDTDWRYFRCEERVRRTSLKRQDDVMLRELRPDDARMLVEAWRKYGTEGLRELAPIATVDEQVAALSRAVREESPAPGEGSFFGGLLAVRLGQDGLQNHVVALLARLKEERIHKSDHTLFDALVYIAACHAVGIAGIDENVLADLVGVPREWVQSLVVNPLGEEAAAVRSAGHVFIRHRRVAAAIVVAADNFDGTDIAEVWSAIVRQTVASGRVARLGPFYGFAVHSGPMLQRALPPEIPDERRKSIAIVAAKTAARYQDNWLGCIVDLGRTYRHANDCAEAVRVFRENLPSAADKVDYADVIRGYWYEWGVCEGRVGDAAEHRAADAWLQGLSLSDHLNPAPITPADLKLTCAGLGVAFGKLAQPRLDCPFAKARRASAYLGRLSNPDPKTASYFDRYDREADKIKTPRPATIAEAIQWLTAGVIQAGHELKDPFLNALLGPEQVSFKNLQQFVTPAPRLVTPPRQSGPPSGGHAATPTPATPELPKAPVLDDRTLEAIERVAQKAWAAAPANGSAEERLSKAKREASRQISMLSPHVRPSVSHHYTSQKWKPLIDREPKP